MLKGVWREQKPLCLRSLLLSLIWLLLWCVVWQSLVFIHVEDNLCSIVLFLKSAHVAHVQRLKPTSWCQNSCSGPSASQRVVKLIWIFSYCQIIVWTTFKAKDNHPQTQAIFHCWPSEPSSLNLIMRANTGLCRVWNGPSRLNLYLPFVEPHMLTAFVFWSSEVCFLLHLSNKWTHQDKQGSF